MFRCITLRHAVGAAVFALFTLAYLGCARQVPVATAPPPNVMEVQLIQDGPHPLLLIPAEQSGEARFPGERVVLINPSTPAAPAR